ncbi:MAG: elongation factor P [Chloroflexi bacterium]|nr:elongation factor P [Chloroflexota bacterium]
MIETGDLKRGVTIEVDGTLYQVLDFQHIKLGRGSAQVRMKLRDVKGGHTIERAFQAGTRFPRVTLEKRTVQYLYSEGSLYYFMDTASFEQFPVQEGQLGDAPQYLTDGLEVSLVFYEGDPIGVELPNSVVLTVTETAPGFRGDTAVSGTKPATTNTGHAVQVPLFVGVGQKVQVDTRTGQYIGRA